MNRIISKEELKLLKEAMGKKAMDSFDDDDIDLSNFYFDESDLDYSNFDNSDSDSNGTNDSSTLNTGSNKGKDISGASKSKSWGNDYFKSKGRKEAGISSLKRIGGIDADTSSSDVNTKTKQNAINNINDYWINHPLNVYNKQDEEDYYLPDQFGRVKVSYFVNTNPKNYEDPISVFKLKNIDPQDCSLLTQMLANEPMLLNISVDSYREKSEIHPERTNDGISLIVDSKDAEKFVSEVIPKIVSKLKSIQDEKGNPKYFKDQGEIDNFYSYLKHEFYALDPDKISDYFKQIEQIEMDNIKLFRRFLAAENDQAVQEFVAIYGRTGLMDQICDEGGIDIRFGKTLSIQNAAIILGSRQLTGAGVTPTFLLTKKVWYKRYGRVVKPNAEPYKLWCPYGQKKVKTIQAPELNTPYTKTYKNGVTATITDVTGVLKDKFKTDDFRSLSYQQKMSLNQFCNPIDTKFFYPCVEFDISDTELLDPNGEDKFYKEVGLSDRFKGTRNQAALDLLEIERQMRQAENNGPTVSDGEDVDANEETAKKNRMDELTKCAYNLLTLYWEKNGMNFRVDVGPDVSYNLVNAIEAQARYEYNKRGKTKQKLQDKLVKMTVRPILVALGVALDIESNYKTVGDTDTENYIMVSSVATLIVKEILEAAMYDSSKGENSPLDPNDGNNPRLVAEAMGVSNPIANLDQDQVMYKLQRAIRAEFTSGNHLNEMEDKFFKTLHRMDLSKKNLLI